MTKEILESVRSKYGAVAESSLSSKNAGVKAVAEAFGYTAEELTAHRSAGQLVTRLAKGNGVRAAKRLGFRQRKKQGANA